ncbi:MAG: phosphatidylserine decarboxylase [Actinomycetota bacterium]|nr:phosphatidylserine decarboxylase [Actinomycetota bacterium]
MAQRLAEWVENEVLRVDDRAPSWLNEMYFFRDPWRPQFVDTSHFFAPADGVILYQKVVKPGESIVDIKGKSYSLREALRDPNYNKESIVIGIFMTFFDVHINRVPYRGTLSYRELEPIETYNRPMLDLENELLYELRVNLSNTRYLRFNQRMVNRIESPIIRQSYYVLQIADYDVDCITPFRLKQNVRVQQGARFSQIRRGSQVDLIVPLSERFDFTFVHEDTDHVQAGVDRLLRVEPKRSQVFTLSSLRQARATSRVNGRHWPSVATNWVSPVAPGSSRSM